MVKCPKGTRKNNKTGLCEEVTKSMILDKIDETKIEELVEKKLDNKLLLDLDTSKPVSSSFKHSNEGDYEILIDKPETVTSETVKNFDNSIIAFQSTVKNVIKISDLPNLTTETNLIEELENIKNIKKETEVQTLKEKISYLVRVFRRFKKCKIIFIICKLFFIIAIPSALAFSLPILIPQIITMIISYYMSTLSLWNQVIFLGRLTYYNIIYADIIANSILVCKLIGTFLLGSSVIKNIAYVYNKDLKEAYVRSIKTKSKTSLKSHKNTRKSKEK
jgi:hypothetical protein